MQKEKHITHHKNLGSHLSSQAMCSVQDRCTVAVKTFFLLHFRPHRVIYFYFIKETKIMSMDQIVLGVVRVMTHLLFLSPDQNHCDESVLSYSQPSIFFSISFARRDAFFYAELWNIWSRKKLRWNPFKNTSIWNLGLLNILWIGVAVYDLACKSRVLLLINWPRESTAVFSSHQTQQSTADRRTDTLCVNFKSQSMTLKSIVTSAAFAITKNRCPFF